MEALRNIAHFEYSDTRSRKDKDFHRKVEYEPWKSYKIVISPHISETHRELVVLNHLRIGWPAKIEPYQPS